jgi:hypothetical protein
MMMNMGLIEHYMLRQYVTVGNQQHQALLHKIAGYQAIVSKIYDFTDEHDFTYLAERNALNWGLCLLFPSVSKSITKLVYDIHYLKKAISEIEQD